MFNAKDEIARIRTIFRNISENKADAIFPTTALANRASVRGEFHEGNARQPAT